VGTNNNMINDEWENLDDMDAMWADQHQLERF
jgi:hypothetical protein